MKVHHFVFLIWVPVLALSVPIVDFDIWGDQRQASSSLVADKDLSRLPRVLNFFPVPFVEECKANDGRRRGICMNTYECRIQGGKSYGFCALGFGVCCVFTSTCDKQVINNITYFVNPDFPDLSKNMSSCRVKVQKIEPEVTQIRFDFVHFNLGQPNRSTGVCEEDIFRISTENATRELTLCGYNSGQHLYFDVENVDGIQIDMVLAKKAVQRIWEVVITQIPFDQRTPPGCLQYFTGSTGVIQTMNFADNGRHLANQDYSICIRQESNMCSISYEQCSEDSFRIAPNTENDLDTNSIEEGSGDYDNELQESVRAVDLCNDKIVLPCDSEELLMPGIFGMNPGHCNLIHCGSTLCPAGQSPCKIESSATPFNIGVHFGETISNELSPEDNLGMCLVYEQIPCEF
ncbi:unnamed protein product [Ceutorhynchus assimilis]|uniref:CUB domain-containing protein n=1 Tax=Ceutorhynchus assimilis TaxID=467358 RepID=A0A9N9N027_9CUCU|nr:unnamed protein product [Ceutorhynchus assimilis]